MAEALKPFEGERSKSSKHKFSNSKSYNDSSNKRLSGVKYKFILKKSNSDSGKRIKILKEDSIRLETMSILNDPNILEQ
jgi:hypothetical protein